MLTYATIITNQSAIKERKSHTHTHKHTQIRQTIQLVVAHTHKHTLYQSSSFVFAILNNTHTPTHT